MFIKSIEETKNLQGCIYFTKIYPTKKSVFYVMLFKKVDALSLKIDWFLTLSKL